MLVYSNLMTREQLVDKFYNDIPNIETLSKYEILKAIHTQNNMECIIGNPSWFVLSTSRLRKMLSKINLDLELSTSEIFNLDRNCILEILFSLDTVFRCYKYSLRCQISNIKELVSKPDIQKKYIYLGATMNKDFSYYLNLLENNQQDQSLCMFIESKYFGKYADIHDLTKYAVAFEHFVSRNKQEQLLKNLRERQIIQEQELCELRRLFQSQVNLNAETSNSNKVKLFLKPIKTQSIDACKRVQKYFTRRKKKDDFTVDASCLVCYINKKTVLYSDCSHISACVDCSEKVGLKCPLCRKISTNKTVVYY